MNVSSPELPVVLVCDPGLDDLYLLRYLLHREYRIGALIVSYGCSTLPNSARNAAGFLELCDSYDIPLILGPAGPLDGRGYDHSLSFGGADGVMNLALTSQRGYLDGDDAFEQLLVELGSVALISSAPATAIAGLHRRNPALIPRHVAERYVMGGTFGPGNAGHKTKSAPRGVAEHNVAHDPDAWAEQLRIPGPPIHLVTWDAAPAIAMPQSALAGAKSRSKPGEVLLQGTRNFFPLYGSDLNTDGPRSFAPLDLLLGLAFDGEGRYERRKISVILDGKERGRTVVDDRGVEVRLIDFAESPDLVPRAVALLDLE